MVNLCYRKRIAKARPDCDCSGQWGQCKGSWWDHFLLFWLKTRVLHSRLWISLEGNILICGINKKGLKKFLRAACLKTTLSHIGGLFKITLFSKKQQLELETVWLLASKTNFLADNSCQLSWIVTIVMNCHNSISPLYERPKHKHWSKNPEKVWKYVNMWSLPGFFELSELCHLLSSW